MNDSTYSDSGAYCERGSGDAPGREVKPGRGVEPGREGGSGRGVGFGSRSEERGTGRQFEPGRGSGDAPGRGVKPGRGGGVVLDADGYFTRSAAVVVWGCVFVVVGVFVSSVVWGWPLGSRDGGTAGTAGTGGGVVVSSGGVDQASSAGVQVGDGQMSGRFEVGKDGKLLRPSDAPIPWQPQLPAAAREETPEGMEAFTRYVLDLVPYMWMSGNTEPLEKVSLPECKWAHDLIRSVNTIYELNGWFEKAQIEVLSLSQATQSNDEPHIWISDAEVKQAAMTGYNGTTVRDFPEKKGLLRFIARYENNAWKLVNVESVQ